MIEGNHDDEGYQGGAGRSQDEDENRDHTVDNAGFFAHELSLLAGYGRKIWGQYTYFRIYSGPIL
jgi:hypothetical protein